jgi:hypothetical protein
MSIQVVEDYLQVDQPYQIDESVTQNQSIEFEPAGSQLNTVGGEIRIDIQNADSYYFPASSYLLVEGDVLKEDGTRYADADLITLTLNGVMFLFSQMQFQINNQIVETIMDVGRASLMKGLASYSDDYSKSSGLNMFWLKDTSATAVLAENTGFAARHGLLITKNESKGSFSSMVPLSHIFGFCEDYRKVLYGCKLSLWMTRQNCANALFKAQAAAKGKVVLTRVAWHIPHIKPSIGFEAEFIKMVREKKTLDVCFRSRQLDQYAVPASTSFSWRLSVQTGKEKPRWLLVAFGGGPTAANKALLMHLKLKNAYVTLNSSDNRYPSTDLKIDFPNNKISKVYEMFANFQKEYYGFDRVVTGNQLTVLEFKELYPIFVFDIRKQSERLKETVTDITLKCEFAENPAAGTMAYALVLSDRMMRLQSDGNKFSTVF